LLGVNYKEIIAFIIRLYKCDMTLVKIFSKYKNLDLELSNRNYNSCPSCKSKNIIPIEYGLPGPEMVRAAEKKEMGVFT